MRPMKYNEFSEEMVERFKKVLEWNKIAGNNKPETVPVQLKLVKEEGDEFSEAYGKVDVIKELIDCLVVTSFAEMLIDAYTAGATLLDKVRAAVDTCMDHAFTLQRMGFNILLAFDKVIESNYSKFDPYREDMLDKYDEHCKYLEKDGRYTNVKWERADNYVVYRSGEGKLLKGRNYQEPDLSFLQEAA